MAKKNIAKKARTFDNGLACGIAIALTVVAIHQGWFLDHLLSWINAGVLAALIWRVPFLFILSLFEGNEYYHEYLLDYLTPAIFKK